MYKLINFSSLTAFTTNLISILDFLDNCDGEKLAVSESDRGFKLESCIICFFQLSLFDSKKPNCTLQEKGDRVNYRSICVGKSGTSKDFFSSFCSL